MSMLSRFATTGGGGDPYWSNVVLLLTGDNLSDSSSNAKPITNNGSVSVNTSVKKYGSGSLYFNGSTAYLSTPNNSAFDFSAGTFTIEFWINQVSNSGAAIYSYVYDYRGGGSATGLLLSGGAPHVMYAGLAEAGSNTPISLNSWTFIAASVNSGAISIYVNGVRDFFGSGPYSFSAGTAPVWIGRPNEYGYYINGYVDDLRVTKGVARYSGTTCPVPTAPFPIG